MTLYYCLPTILNRLRKRGHSIGEWSLSSLHAPCKSSHRKNSGAQTIRCATVDSSRIDCPFQPKGSRLGGIEPHRDRSRYSVCSNYGSGRLPLVVHYAPALGTVVQTDASLAIRAPLTNGSGSRGLMWVSLVAKGDGGILHHAGRALLDFLTALASFSSREASSRWARIPGSPSRAHLTACA